MKESWNRTNSKCSLIFVFIIAISDNSASLDSSISNINGIKRFPASVKVVPFLERENNLYPNSFLN